MDPQLANRLLWLSEDVLLANRTLEIETAVFFLQECFKFIKLCRLLEIQGVIGS